MLQSETRATGWNQLHREQSCHNRKGGFRASSRDGRRGRGPVFQHSGPPRSCQDPDAPEDGYREHELGWVLDEAQAGRPDLGLTLSGGCVL